MNKKRIANHLNKLIDDWCKSIEDKELVDVVKKNVIVTGGSIVSLLNSDSVNDYDLYFKTRESCAKLLEYYIEKYNSNMNRIGGDINFLFDDDKNRFFVYNDAGRSVAKISGEKGSFHLKYISNNAITLSENVQLVVRFWGELEDIHANYDFIHCTCGYDYEKEKVYLPSNALESIINKELVYMGSKYPLCSIIRTRKFIERGWHINAGQYLKMCMQLNDLNLRNIEILQDQLVGVDSAYFCQLIDAFESWKEDNNKTDISEIDNAYIFRLVDEIF